MDKNLQRIIKIIGLLCITYLILLIFPTIKIFFEWLLRIILPFLIGFIGAYLLIPLVDRLTRCKVSYKASVIIVVSMFVVFSILILMIVIPKTIYQFNLLFENIPSYIDNVSHFLDDISNKMDFLPNEFLPTPNNVYLFLQNLGNKISGNLNKILENITYYLVVILLSPVLIVYFLFEFKNIKQKLKNYLLEKNKEEMLDTLIQINKNVRNYFNGVLIVMVLLSLLATILFSIIGVEHSLLWGIIIGVTNIIPYIGPYIGGAIVVAFTLLTSYKKALIVLVVIVLLQLIESNFISPNIHSKTMKTSPILVLLFISIFGQIMGIFGMIIAIPFLSIFQILVNKIPLLKN